MRKPIKVHVDVEEMLRDVKALHYTERTAVSEMHANHVLFYDAKKSGDMNVEHVKKFCETFFPNEPKRYERYVAVHDLPMYEGLMNIENLDKSTVKVDCDKMTAKLNSIGLKPTAVMRLFDYEQNYFSNVKQCGRISLDFLYKFCDLVGDKCEDYVLPEDPPKTEPAPQVPQKKAEAVDLSPVIDKLKKIEEIGENVDACNVGILKELQKITTELKKINKALGCGED
jgi:hypothetical protein